MKLCRKWHFVSRNLFKASRSLPETKWNYLAPLADAQHCVKKNTLSAINTRWNDFCSRLRSLLAPAPECSVRQGAVTPTDGWHWGDSCSWKLKSPSVLSPRGLPSAPRDKAPLFWENRSQLVLWLCRLPKCTSRRFYSAQGPAFISGSSLRLYWFSVKE